MSKLIHNRKVKILSFDIESRPLSFWIPEHPTAEITAIASCWVDDPDSMEVYLLGRESTTLMLDLFVDRYNNSDMVTGHYIRKFDLPVINGALLELGWAPLRPILTSDTRLDMYSKRDIPATQEHLAEMLHVPAPKIHMTQAMWREANRLTEKGLALTYERVRADVEQQILLRNTMIALGLLKPPKVWAP